MSGSGGTWVERASVLAGSTGPNRLSSLDPGLEPPHARLPGRMQPLAAKVLRDLRFHDLGQALAARAQTDVGRARCLAWPFPADAAAVTASLDLVEEIRGLNGEGWELPVGAVRDVRPLSERAKRGGVLEPPELVGCARVLRALTRLKDFLDDRRDALPHLAVLAEGLGDLGMAAARVEGTFDEAGEVADRASPFLAELRDKARREQRQIKARLDAMLHDEKFLRLLQEPYFTLRNERYVVPVQASFRAQLPGIVHNASQTGHTLFVEPESLIALGNELAIAQSLAREEERRILKELSEDLGASADDAARAIETAAAIDAFQAAARLSRDLGASRPEILPGQERFRLMSLRHPLLAVAGRSVVANDIVLPDGARSLVISGPNAGGKTVTITGIGLCAAMVRAGLPITAAAGSRMPLYDDIRIAIGDDQDLAADLSSFTAHLGGLRDIAAAAGPGVLVLVDEIAAGTDPREGAAIALAVLEDLAGRGACTLVTTHLDELKALGLTDPRFAAARVGFDAERVAPTYRLEMGRAGSSSAIEIARHVGLPAAVCDRAQALLHGGVGPLTAALAAVESERAGLERSRRETDEARAHAERARAEAESQRRSLFERERAVVAGAREDLVREVEAARAVVRAIVAKLQTTPSHAAAAEARRDLSALDRTAAAAPAAPPAGRGDELRPGMRVRLDRLGQEGEVAQVDGDAVVVTVGAMRVNARRDEVVPSSKRGSKRGRIARRDAGEAMAAAAEAAPRAIEAPANTCDVRGFRADDALRAIQAFLDGLYRRGEPSAVIVHGHGTGRLKVAIREHLKASPYVKGYRPGESHEGGDGATVVQLG